MIMRMTRVPDADRGGEEKTMEDDAASADHRALIGYANTRPILLDLLYDLDLMPEQVTTPAGRWRMVRIIGAFRAAETMTG